MNKFEKLRELEAALTLLRDRELQPVAKQSKPKQASPSPKLGFSVELAVTPATGGLRESVTYYMPTISYVAACIDAKRRATEDGYRDPFVLNAKRE